MKTIKEQYKEIVCGWNEERTENVSNRCTEIADEFAVDFLHWYLNNDDIKKFSYSYKDLLKYFKKEKGL